MNFLLGWPIFYVKLQECTPSKETQKLMSIHGFLVKLKKPRRMIHAMNISVNISIEDEKLCHMFQSIDTYQDKTPPEN